MAFIKVCSLSELPNNSQKIVPLGPHKIALFHFNNEISAIANACLHLSTIRSALSKFAGWTPARA